MILTLDSKKISNKDLQWLHAFLVDLDIVELLIINKMTTDVTNAKINDMFINKK